MSYSHFTLQEREYLQSNYNKGMSIRQIAFYLGRSPSTISRELKRNWSKKAKHYNAWHAHTNYLHNRKKCHRKNNLLSNPEMYRFVLESLLKHWSPEIIAGSWNVSHNNKMSFSSIYRAVRSNEFPGIKPWTHFRRKGKKYAPDRKSYCRFPGRSIHDRPEIIDERGRFGDFEGDTIYGSIGKGYLVTAIDRKSRFLVAATCKDKKIETINAAFKEAFNRSKINPLTLTLDNGSEFGGYEDLETELGLKVYFADLHAPWQRGSNENINGLLRYFFPRGTDFRHLSREKLDIVLDLINSRPRKCLQFLSPQDIVDSL